MTYFEMLIALMLAAVMIFVGYQIYFFPQKYLLDRARSPVTGMDNLIPFQPRWVWIYSGVYYPFWVSPILITPSLADFLGICVSYVILLAAHMLVSHIYPVKTPTDWRQYDPANSVSERFLGLVQNLDKGGNAFPSMHVAVAVLTALHLVSYTAPEFYPQMYLVWIMPACVAASTLYTKQHLVVDIPAGVLLAFAVYAVHANYV